VQDVGNSSRHPCAAQLNASAIASSRHVDLQVAARQIRLRGIKLPAGDLEYAAAPQMTLDLDVVPPGEQFDFRLVAVNDNLHRLVGPSFDAVGQGLRKFDGAGRAGLAGTAGGWQRQI
jgi:hypothetical protein